MRRSIILKSVLICAGLVALGVGTGMVFVPVAFHASAGIVLEDNAGLLSEMRASGSVVLLSALVILLGAFVRRLAFAATLMATLLYLSYGMGRLLSLAIDGLPGSRLLQIAGAELVIGLICGAMLFGFRGSGVRDESRGVTA